ncbi:hypothetical protein M2273_002990 [Mucilaginibacter lappiensis]
MNNGFIYKYFNNLINFLKYLNLLELFKFIAKKLVKNQNDSNKVIKYRIVASDLFILTKWIFILLIWFLGKDNFFLRLSMWYLIISNLFTFFYYLVWKEDLIINQSIARSKRRFIHVIQAVFFSHFSFALLYSLSYKTDFTSTQSKIHWLNYLWYSISNSVSGNYDVIKPITDWGYSVSMIQFIITFLFVVVIISRAIPETNR